MIKLFLLTTALLFSLNTFADSGSGHGSNNGSGNKTGDITGLKIEIDGKKKICKVISETRTECTTTTWDENNKPTVKTTVTVTITEVPVACPKNEMRIGKKGCKRNVKYSKSRRAKKIKPNHLRKIAKK